MNLIEYPKPEIEEYELLTWQEVVCDGLAAIKMTEDTVLWDCTGCANILDYVKPDRKAGVTDGFCRILSAFRKIVEAELMAKDYLIEETSISLDPEKLWIDESSGKAKLLPGAYSESFFIRLVGLADRMGAEKLAERLIENNNKSAMSEKELLKFFSAWELELR